MQFWPTARPNIASGDGHFLRGRFRRHHRSNCWQQGEAELSIKPLLALIGQRLTAHWCHDAHGLDRRWHVTSLSLSHFVFWTVAGLLHITNNTRKSFNIFWAPHVAQKAPTKEFVDKNVKIWQKLSTQEKTSQRPHLTPPSKQAAHSTKLDPNINIF